MSRLNCFDADFEKGLLGDFFEAYKNTDIAAVEKVFLSVLKAGRFDLKHPTEDDVLVTCLNNIRVGSSNVLVFSGADLKHSLYIIQIQNFIDFVVTNSEIYNFSLFKDRSAADRIVKVLGLPGDFVSSSDMKVKKILGGLVLGHGRPYHNFYDQIVNMPKLAPTLKAMNYKTVVDRFCYFNPECIDGVFD